MALTPQHAARVLGLDLAASLADVRQARRALARRYHPDQACDRARATLHMARINAAVDTLMAHIRTSGAARRQKASCGASAGKTSSARPQRSGESPKHEKRASAERTGSAPNAKGADRGQPDVDLTRQASVRKAVQSYGKVLRDIGQGPDATCVDVRVLRMQVA